MSSSSPASTKDLIKAINSFIVDPVLPLPVGLLATIDSYLQKHHTYDDSTADRLHDELIHIFEKHVRGNPAATGPWIGILRRLQWALQSPEKVLFWFDASQKIMENTPLEKNVVKETVDAMMNTIKVADKCQDSYQGGSESNPIIGRLLAVWMDQFYPALLDGKKAVEYNETMLRDALGKFGKRRPKEFFASLDKYFVKKRYRRSVLRFFCDFIQSQPPHLHQVLQTALFDHILTCLQKDTSTTVVSAALTCLIMLLPHMPSSLVPHLPTLFNIYARLLFWDRERMGAVELPSHEDEQLGSWEVCSYDASTEGRSISHLPQYFTMLYGLYPINFMDYIRKPQRYLRHANIANVEDIEVQPTEIRHHSERFRSCHLLHPNFYTLTIESEKSDFGRWLKCEAAEVVAECVGLCASSEATHYADPTSFSVHGAFMQETNDVHERGKPDAALLSSSVTKVDAWQTHQISSADSVASDRMPSTLTRRLSQSSLPSHRDFGDTKLKNVTDSPALPIQLGRSPSHSQLQDLIKSNKVIKSGLHQSLANDSVASLTLSHHGSHPEKSLEPPMAPPPLPISPEPSTLPEDVASRLVFLQRRVLLLENDLSFERYLKQQHITHIGDLRGRHVNETRTEAELQDLIMTTRNLKNRYEEAKKAELQVRKESEKSRAMAKKWEADLSNKLKNLREESKRAHIELEEVRKELASAKDECESLRRLVCDAEVRELSWKQNMQSIEMHGAEIDRLKTEIYRLTLSERDHQAQELERQKALSLVAEADNKAVALELKLTAQENEMHRAKKLLQTQIQTLQSQLSEAQEEQTRPGTNTSIAVESALAGSRAKQAGLQKQYDLLLRKYKVLQSSLLDMRSTSSAPSESHIAREKEGVTLSSSVSPVMINTRAHRVLSEPDTSREPMVYNLAQTLSHQQAAAHPVAETSRSPDQRYFGGLSSRLRKDSADKGKDDNGNTSSKPKEKKKSTGLRHIRGFVN